MMTTHDEHNYAKAWLTPQDKLKVLFVDDDEVNIESFLVYFRDEYLVLTATSGEEALELFQREKDIAMVISDQRMPGMSGVDLLAHIYELKPETVRIIITGYMDVSDIIDSINKSHIYQYILKPWDIVQLQLILEQACQTWRLTRAIRLLSAELLEKNTRLSHLTSALITAQENERKRISMELHDELGQSLTVVKLNIKSIENELNQEGTNKHELQKSLGELRQFLNEIITNLRRISKDLSPVIIDDLGLDAALDNLVSNFTQYNKINCEFNHIHIGELFATDSQRLIYRLVQEAINNVAKHADATTLHIDIQAEDNSVNIRLSDNGKGFCVNEALRIPMGHRGIGLTAMMERVNMLCGNMEITSEPGAGTSLEFIIPVARDRRLHE